MANGAERVIAREIENGTGNVEVLLVPLFAVEGDFDTFEGSDFSPLEPLPVFALDCREQCRADDRVRHTGAASCARPF